MTLPRRTEIRPMDDFQEIERYSNWCYYDRLGGKDIQNREVLDLLFPDGTIIESQCVFVDKREQSYNDHGHDTHIPIRDAYVEIGLFGASGRIYLRREGVRARRRNNA